jgi:SAM-dependent methyltransferase
MPVQDPTQRFSSRVDHYIRYRPGYPPEVADLLKSDCGLGPDSVVADIASGTGLFTQLLLEQGSQVFGVEPNAAMRQAGEQFLTTYKRFRSVGGSAEATTLAEHSVDIITAAQAAHWFERTKTRREFVRILKPEGWLVLVWNERRTDSTPFLREYEQLLLTYGTDYQDVRHEHTTASIDSFFAPAPFQERVFDHRQELDYPALEGRLLSSSYAPPPGNPKHEPILHELRRVFAARQKQGRVAMEYNTRVYYGKLT